MLDQHRFSVVVLGSGFAGSLTALILAKSGIRVAIVDRSSHPRFAIGESSTPAADYLLESLARQFEIPELLPICRYGSWCETYPQIRRGCKRGFSYVWHGRGDQYQATAKHDCELMVAASSTDEMADTQWYRPDTDKFLFDLSLRYGVQAWQTTELFSAQKLDRDGARWNLQLRNDTHGDFSIRTDFVVDGSGPNSLFHRQVADQDLSSKLKTQSSACYTHVQGCKLSHDWLTEQGALLTEHPYHFDKAAVHHLFDEGWLWKIRFCDDITSIGFVSRLDATNEVSASLPSDSLQCWSNAIRRYPTLRSVLGDVELAKLPGKFIQTGRLQRLRLPACDLDWAALPFTVGFIDPLHSTGIAHSLVGVEKICTAILSSDPMKKSRQLANYNREIASEIQLIDQMVSGCYLSLFDFRLFTCWTMLYFAAATSFERLHREGSPPSFLLAGDSAFREIVSGCYQALRDLVQQRLSSSGNSRSHALNSNWMTKQINHYIDSVKMAISPYNSVGLFAPQYPNMYWHTIAK